MNPPPTLHPFVPLARGALRRDVVAGLLTAIFRGELSPGTRLVAQKLASQFGISSTPIREALVELETVGMVLFVHNRGAVVKHFGPDQLREIYHLRRILETEATRCACGRLDRTSLEALKREMTTLLRGDVSEEWSRLAMAADRRLHALIAEGCGNVRLADEIRRYEILIQATRDLVGNQRHVQEQALLEHLPVLDALMAGEAEVAAGQMARHIDSTAESVAGIIFGGR